MSDRSEIEWLNFPGYQPASWNPVKGCSRVSNGCTRCYAERMAARFSKPGMWGHGVAEMRRGKARWTGLVELDEAKLLLPLKWKKPRCIFVNSTSDLFHEKLPDAAINKVFAVMQACPQHLFIVLTKRSARMREYVNGEGAANAAFNNFAWPLPNVILGVSVEDRAALYRLDDLRATPAACRMISLEPLLEDLGDIDLTGIGWAVTGGESGRNARPTHPDCFRSVRDQCKEAGVPFFFKQHGEWLATADDNGEISYGGHERHGWDIDGPHEAWAYRVGKKRAGRLLDGREHNEFPGMG